jgi:predicted house-cleaning noncanonical NTP pyrophosphatase (MazG superfamily)
MRTFRLSKLVRDGIVPSHEREGGWCVWREISGDELQDASKAKVEEEVEELFGSEEARTAAAYADVVEAVLNDAELFGLSRQDVMFAMLTKARQLGMFKEGIFVETATVPETSWLATYYAANPGRFPEVL